MDHQEDPDWWKNPDWQRQPIDDTSRCRTEEQSRRDLRVSTKPHKRRGAAPPVWLGCAPPDFPIYEPDAWQKHPIDDTSRCRDEETSKRDLAVSTAPRRRGKRRPAAPAAAAPPPPQQQQQRPQ
jgi:hypothetical protein